MISTETHPMFLFDILQLHHPDLQPHRCKLHLAVHTGEDDPQEHWKRVLGSREFGYNRN